MNYFLTGCDKNTEWQLPWFTNNYAESGTKTDLVIADFGMTEKGRKFAEENSNFVIDAPKMGWFSKVYSMWKMIHFFKEDDKFCWIDTDCEIKGYPDTIFDYVEKNKLTMVVDHPWTENGSPWTPQGIYGPWYNSGVVAFQGRPPILGYWFNEVRDDTDQRRHRGDQEALYWLLNQDPMNRVVHIHEAPHKYNVLRLDVLQKRVPKNPVIMHWTGQKGKEEIIRQMKL